MADIIVRIPKDQLGYFYCNKMESPVAFWRFANKPKRLSAGDFIWFTRPDGVIAGAQITEITDKDIEDTDAPQGRWKAVWKGNATHLLNKAVANIQYAGRGFRYLTPEEQKRLRRASYTS